MSTSATNPAPGAQNHFVGRVELFLSWAWTSTAPTLEARGPWDCRAQLLWNVAEERARVWLWVAPTEQELHIHRRNSHAFSPGQRESDESSRRLAHQQAMEQDWCRPSASHQWIDCPCPPETLLLVSSLLASSSRRIPIATWPHLLSPKPH